MARLAGLARAWRDRVRDWLDASLRNRVALAAAALSLGIFLLTGSLFLASTVENARQYLRFDLEHRAELQAIQAEQALAQAQAHLAGMAANALVVNALLDSSGREAYLRPFLKTIAPFAPDGTVWLTDYRGRPLLGQGSGNAAAVGEETWFQEVLTSQRPQALLTPTPSGGQRLRLVQPVIYAYTHTVEGLLILDVALDRLVTLPQQEATYHYWLLDAPASRGLIQVRRPLRLPAPLNELGLGLGVGIDAGQAYRPALRLALAFLPLVLAVTWLTVHLARRAARHLTQPLENFATLVEAVRASGNLDRRLPARGHDELGRLSAAFNDMLRELRDDRALLEQRVADRTRELHQREIWLRAILDNVPFFFWLKDAEGRFIQVNEHFARGTGHGSPEEHIGKTDLDVWPEDLAWSYMADDRAVLASGQEKCVEEPVQQGEDRGWLETYKKPLHDSAGRVSGTVGFARDISDRKRAELALAKQNARLDAIFALSPDGFIACDAQDRVEYANGAVLRTLGLAEGELRGLGLEALDAQLRERCEQPERYPGLAALFDSDPRENGLLLELRWPSRAMVAVKGVQGGQDGPSRVLYFRDVTREAEVDRMKSEFLSTAAHELRTPMASIYGFSELLAEGGHDPETVKDLAQTIHGQSVRMTSIINELLDLARIEARRGKDFRYQPVLLAEVVAQAIAGVRPDPERHPVSLAIDSTAWVTADPGKLVQALVNILGNAVKYSPAGGGIDLESLGPDADHPGLLGIAVRDRGIGMTPEQCGRVFDRFWRADTSGHIPGTGLGMAIVKEIVDLHGGRIEVVSRAGQGTTVRLWLRRAEAEHTTRKT